MTDDARALGMLAAIAMMGVALSGCGGADAPAIAPEPDEPVTAPDSSETQVVVYKSRRQLILFRPGMPPKTYHIALGAEPDGDKERQGDGRTPTGTFYVCEKNLESKYYLFIAISYPNEEDADRGLEAGLITQAQHDAILAALAARKTPPWHTRLGGEIGLHGGGASWDWTRGCVALDNGDMRELYALVRVGMTVIIKP